MALKLSEVIWFTVFVFTLAGGQDVNDDEFVVVSSTPANNIKYRLQQFFDDQLATCAALTKSTYLLEANNLQTQKTLDKQINQFSEKMNVIIKQVEKEQKETISAIETTLKKSHNITENKLQETKQQIINDIGRIYEKQFYDQKLNNNCSIELIHDTKQHITTEIENILDKKMKLINSIPLEVKQDLKTLEKEVESHTKLLAELQKSVSRLLTTPRNCQDLQERGNTVSGIYQIQPEFALNAFMVLCDMKTQGGGWAYLLSRFDGSENFNRNWTDYKDGFGQLNGEFWLGLDHLYELIGYRNSELLIELVDWENNTLYARYEEFSIGSEKESYNLKLLEGFSGDGSDYLTQHRNMNFSTPDRDSSSYCAKYFHGAWWFKKCFHSHLNGRYLKGNSTTSADGQGIHWGSLYDDSNNYDYSFKQVRMMVRPSKKTAPFLLPHERNL